MSAPWLVVGKGAIGLLAASRWLLSAQSVLLWQRTPQPLSYRFSAGGRDFAMQLQNASQGPFSKVLVPVKAYDVVNVVKTLLPHLADEAQLVLCHNGMGTLEPVAALLKPGQGLWFASTSHGAYKPHALHIIHSGQGNTILAPCNDAARNCTAPIAAELTQALSPLTQVDDIQPYLWQKLAVNSVINPLTALHQCQNGELNQPQYQAQIKLLLAEFVQVAAACGQLFSGDRLYQLVQQVQSNTAQNFSSMLQDVSAGRRTELGAITGYLLQQAAAHQLAMPEHQALYQALAAKLAPWQL